MAKEVKPYSYFDKPDGEDVFRKLLHVLKPTALTAAGIGTVDVMCYSHPKGYIQTLGRYAYIGLPILGVSTAFVCTTNLAATLRKKDDKLNWFIGGFTAGTVFGVWRKRAMLGFNMGMLLGIFAFIKKYGLENGWDLMPPDGIPIAAGGIWIAKSDYTLMAERPRNWTRGD